MRSYAILLLAIVFCVSGCSLRDEVQTKSETGRGRLLVGINLQGTGDKGFQTPVARLSATLSKGTYSVSREVAIINNAGSIEFPELEVGYWSISIDAMDDSGDVIYKGRQIGIFIAANETTSVTVPLYPALGNMLISVDARALIAKGHRVGSVCVNCSLVSSSLVSDHYLEHMERAKYRGVFELDLGTWCIQASVLADDNETILWRSSSELIDIVPGQTATLAFSTSSLSEETDESLTYALHSLILEMCIRIFARVKDNIIYLSWQHMPVSEVSLWYHIYVRERSDRFFRYYKTVEVKHAAISLPEHSAKKTVEVMVVPEFDSHEHPAHLLAGEVLRSKQFSPAVIILP